MTMMAPIPLPNSTSIINQTMALADKGLKLRDMRNHPEQTLAKADTATKLMIFENEFALAKRRGLPYPRSWNEVNRLLNANYRQQDFNALGTPHRYIGSMNDLKKAFKSVHAAYEDLDSAWVVRTCKRCGKEFVLSYRQTRWYERVGLDLPDRCEECSHKTEGGI